MSSGFRQIRTYADAFGRLLSHYASHPDVLVRHTRRAADAVRLGGFQLLRERLDAVLRPLRAMDTTRYRDAPSAGTNRPAEAHRRNRGTILIVSHDAALGGAQQIIRTFAAWLLRSTRYEVRLVLLRGGDLVGRFNDIAPTCNLAALSVGKSREQVVDELSAWAGDDVKAVFLNSAASGGFLDIWPRETPIVAFIHEMPKILKLYTTEFAKIRARAATIIAGSSAVRDSLAERHGLEGAHVPVVTAFLDAEDGRKTFGFEDKLAAKRTLGMNESALVVAACGIVHWRKSPGIFIDVAEKVLRDHPGEAHFIWVGDGPDREHFERLLRAKGLTNVRFTGIEPDIMRYLDAADIFLLPSEEDPFPIVCLHAATALAPVICFEEAGGMPGFVARGCGRAVPFKDADAMAAAVLDYAFDKEKRRAHGAAGQKLVAAEYTVATTGPQLLHHIRAAAGLRPEVSVVVPSYNCAPYLGERMATIGAQTFQDFEVIVIDDCSTDGSVAILDAWSALRPGTRMIVNARNSGSPFPQWLHGMGVASGPLIWVAEADDSCERDFLATLLPAFDDRNVFLAHARSLPVDASGTVVGSHDAYLDRIAAGRWAASFVATDHEEAASGLGIANCIPNASGAVFRRFDPDAGFAETLKGMRLCGDWFFYLRAMRGGLVAYEAAPLNRHRRHAETVTHKSEGSRRYFDEFETVRRWIAATYRQDPTTRAAIKRFTTEDLDRFGISNTGERARVLGFSPPPARAKAMPTILVVVSDLSPGGGQMFGIRLANAWARRGGRAVLLNARHFPDHPKVVAKISDRVAVFHADTMAMSFVEMIKRFDIDVVHSSIWWADRYVQDQIEALPGLPWVVTMHGCHETNIDNPGVDLSFPARMGRMLGRVDLWVHTAEKNRRVFASYGLPNSERHIANGLDIEPSA
ncbi:MAG: glycosyltransferase, partial [Mesorhizobium sp.]|nr:glycosyltransferase [Mesorhizobium sp.]